MLKLSEYHQKGATQKTLNFHVSNSISRHQSFFCLTNTSDLEAYLYRDNKMDVDDIKLGGSIDLLEGKEGSTGGPVEGCLMG